jgi:hypothetical protein
MFIAVTMCTEQMRLDSFGLFDLVACFPCWLHVLHLFIDHKCNVYSYMNYEQR